MQYYLILRYFFPFSCRFTLKATYLILPMVLCIFSDFGQAAQTKKATVPRGIESFTVKMNSEGELEAISSLDPENVAPIPGADPGVKEPKPRGRPRKKPKLDSNPDLVAIGRVIAVMEDEDPQQLAFKGKKIYSDVKSNPRSLLLKSEEKTTDLDKKTTVRLILFCSVCEAQCDSQAELKHHAATHHKGSKFFVLPKNNPHRNCAQCTGNFSFNFRFLFEKNLGNCFEQAFASNVLTSF